MLSAARQPPVGVSPTHNPRKGPTVSSFILPLVAVALVGRAAHNTYTSSKNRRLVRHIWTGTRPTHLMLALGILAAVIGVLIALVTYVPVLNIGLANLFGGTGGNIVGAPFELLAETSPLLMAAGAMVYGTTLVAILPRLAYEEEVLFRATSIDLTHSEQITKALVFGLVHMLVLVPLSAALAIAVGGYLYTRVWLHRFHNTNLNLDGAADDRVLMEVLNDLHDANVTPTREADVMYNRLIEHQIADKQALQRDLEADNITYTHVQNDTISKAVAQADATLHAARIHTIYNTIIMVGITALLVLAAFFS